MKTATVLLISDDPQDLASYGTALRSLGYEVSLCGSYDDGLQALEPGNADFVIVNQGTTDFEGRLVLDRAAELDPRPPVLVIAHKADVHCFFDAMDLGAVDYLENPGFRDLLWTVATRVSPPN